MNKLIDIIESKTNIKKVYIKNILELLEEGCTIPFIARYRKDKTGNLSDEELREFMEVYEYNKKLEEKKEEIKENLKQKDVLNDRVLKSINEALTLTALDDIYAPFKDSKNSRTQKAIENGLEGLANIIQSMKYEKDDIDYKAKKFLNNNIKSIDEAVAGAKDIIAQRYADDFRTKEIIRNLLENQAVLECKATKTFEENGVYKIYKEFSQKVKFIPSYRFLAINRAVSEKQLSIKIDIDEKRIIENIKKYKIPSYANSSSKYVLEAYTDGLKRLLLPSLKREIVSNLKERASSDAIALFGKNLHQLLISPPVINQVILGVDPGYKTGCKICVIDDNAKYLDSDVIYPTKPKEDYETSAKKVLNFIKKYKINSVAIGNGTASNETAQFFARLIQENDLDIKFAVVSEIGASVYSASKIANEEYPNLDVTIRGAISIASRLRDPMSELVKIDAKSLGVGQYQHDVNQTKLTKKLNDVTESLVNSVGVDINSASYKLLSYISGISERIAKNIVEYREINGVFKSKKELLKVKGLGAKAYEQSVGFFRIKDGKDILDNTGIHPENYQIANYLLSIDLDNINKKELIKEKNISELILNDIIKELKKPGFDIREELPQTVFRDDTLDFDSLKEGDKLSGVVRNITDFGAFVDVGLKNDGLIHISKICEKKINHPMEVLSLNQYLPRIKIDEIDRNRGKISLTLV